MIGKSGNNITNSVEKGKIKTLAESLNQKILRRKNEHNFRKMEFNPHLTDFASNDYLGLARSKEFYNYIQHYAQPYENLLFSGAGSARLISGNHPLYDLAEQRLAEYYQSEKCLIFNSGYDANVGLFSSLCERKDFILYDELVHASIRDGIRLSHARAYSFRHNDLEDLDKKVQYIRQRSGGNIVVAVESVYSMEGVQKKSGKYFLEEIAEYCQEKEISLIVDEAHASGIFGKSGEGMTVSLNLQKKVFARIHTFGKALGVHGAMVCGPAPLYDYLVNFARSFIYTTALPPHSLLSILAAHEYISKTQSGNFGLIQQLRNNIQIFKNIFYKDANDYGNDSAIHSIFIKGNENARTAANACIHAGFDVRAILSPTVAKGSERLRLCIHSFNTEAEMTRLCKVISR